MKKKKEGLKLTRRQFLKYSGIAGAAAVLPWKMAVREAWAQYGFNSPNLTKFVDPIRPVGVIPLAGPDGFRTWGTTVAQHYTIDIAQFNDILHSDFVTQTRLFKNWRMPPFPAFISTSFAGTKLWGFGQGGNHMHLGGVIVATKGVPVQITFRNNLPPAHIIPVDTTIPGANQAQNRTAIHIHGGFVPWISDGGPFDWWAPDGTHGDSFLNNEVLRPAEFLAGTIPTNEAEYYYPNNQSERLVWYHDHAYGITRINAYAGIASGYVIHDPAADAIITGQHIPSQLDLELVTGQKSNTHYLVFQDKYFFGPAGPPANYLANAEPGDLGYPYIYDPALFGPAGPPSFGGGLQQPFPTPSVVPEMFGDTILVNGTAYPFLEVQAKQQRFVMLNACSSRFLNPRLVGVLGRNNFPDNAEPDPRVAGPSFLQIGTEGGYLPGAVPVNGPKQLQLLISPAERADLVVDFTGIRPGTEFILYNDAAGPYPGGARIFDYYPGNPKTPVSVPGFGPNTRTLLKVRVVAATSASPPLSPTITLPFGALYGDPPLVTQTPAVPIVPVIDRVAGTASVVGGPQNVTFRSLTLNEGFDEYGRLAQYLGTNSPTNPGFFGKTYLDTPTEVVPAGTTEVWEIANLSADTHPIHFHLVNVQILARQPFSVRTYTGIPNFSGAAVAPDANELGWKETVRMNPGEVIWVIMKFDLPVVPFTVPASLRTGGNEYVWHCHILEHEEHDMMRPLVVT